MPDLHRYMLMVSFGFFCLTGTMGFYACYMFVRKIYRQAGGGSSEG